MEQETKSFNFKQFLISPMGKFAMIAVMYFVIMGLILLLLTVFEGAPVVAVIMAIFLGYFGWQALTRITPNVFLIMPVGGWIAYFLIKGCLAFFLGVFVAPFVISKKIIGAIENNIE